jgi:Skp family chaperone for outer membrane proteins
MQRSLFFVTPILLALAVSAAVADDQPVGKIGVFDLERLWKETEVGKKYNKDLSDSHDRFQSGIEKKQQEIEALVDKLRQQQASLSDDKAQQMQKDIQNKRVELNRMSEDADREMKQQVGDLQGRFQAMVVDTVEAYGKEKTFTLILNKAVVDYFADRVDITQDLVGKFNEINKAQGGLTKAPDKKSAAPAPAKAAPKATDKPKETPKETPKP